MSFLDPVKETLNPEIFNEKGRFRADRLDEIKTLLYRLVPEGGVHKLIMLGSMAGYQYGDKSDIDVMVILNKGYDREVFHTRKKKAPKAFLPGTEHEVTFFFQDYQENPRFEDAKFAVFDLDENLFLADPVKVEYDPKEKFKEQMWFAGKILDKINAIAEEYKADKEDLNKLHNKTPEYRAKLREIQDGAEKLVGWFRKLDEDRKTAYYGGWGTPRESQQNITYKMFEYSKNKKLIAELEKQFGEEIPNII